MRERCGLLDGLLAGLAPGAKVLDYGCLGWKLIARSGQRKDIEHHGCDLMTPREVPAGAHFHLVDAKAPVIPTADDAFDLVVASHVLEHVAEPLRLFEELVRVCKPGGSLYVETPSERSLLVRSHPQADAHGFFSFWDDPTHLRPWPPAALYRLAISYGCMPQEWRYMTSRKDRWLYPLRYLYYSLRKNPFMLGEIMKSAKGLECYMVAKKPTDMKGKPDYRYAYLKDVPAGVENAMKYYRAGG